MSTETTKKKIKIDNGTEFARVYTDKEVDSKLSGLSSTDTEINLYKHFIKITGTKDTTQVIARFTIQSSNNLVVDTPEKLATLLGNEFELGCNGIYGNYSITGLKKTADGPLNIIYNNGGAESLQSVAGLTISISDKVKTV